MNFTEIIIIIYKITSPIEYILKSTKKLSTFMVLVAATTFLPFTILGRDFTTGSEAAKNSVFSNSLNQ